MHTKIEKEKFTYVEVKSLINKLLDQDHREIEKLPPEFQEYKDILIKMDARPNEPQAYECCGTGCSPCIWEIYDNRLNSLDDLIYELYKQVNSKIRQI